MNLENSKISTAYDICIVIFYRLQFTGKLLISRQFNPYYVYTGHFLLFIQALILIKLDYISFQPRLRHGEPHAARVLHIQYVICMKICLKRNDCTCVIKLIVKFCERDVLLRSYYASPIMKAFHVVHIVYSWQAIQLTCLIYKITIMTTHTHYTHATVCLIVVITYKHTHISLTIFY